MAFKNSSPLEVELKTKQYFKISSIVMKYIDFQLN